MSVHASSINRLHIEIISLSGDLDKLGGTLGGISMMVDLLELVSLLLCVLLVSCTGDNNQNVEKLEPARIIIDNEAAICMA